MICKKLFRNIISGCGMSSRDSHWAAFEIGHFPGDDNKANIIIAYDFGDSENLCSRIEMATSIKASRNGLKFTAVMSVSDAGVDETGADLYPNPFLINTTMNDGSPVSSPSAPSRPRSLVKLL